MAALEWGTLTDGAYGVAGDAVLGDGFSRTFVTSSAGGFPQVVTITALPALVNPGADEDDPTAQRDVCEVTEVHTYLHGAELDGGDPFDSEYTYAWPVDYWPASTLDEHGQPTLDAMTTSARAHVEHLPQAWIDAMTPPPAGTVIPGQNGVNGCAQCGDTFAAHPAIGPNAHPYS